MAGAELCSGHTRKARLNAASKRPSQRQTVEVATATVDANRLRREAAWS